ncbi:MAG: hypothetical protein QXD48_02780 [Candidatus Aenigmatarchaeota archaeon]
MKGISPLVATVLLIVIVVAISTIVMNWLYSFTSGAQETVSNRTSESISCSGASIEIQDVYLTSGTPGSGSVIIRNNGVVDDMIIVSAQMYNKAGSNFSATNVPVGDFDRGKIITLTFSNLNITTCADFSQVVVSTSCSGVSDSFKGTPKGC